METCENRARAAHPAKRMSPALRSRNGYLFGLGGAGVAQPWHGLGLRLLGPRPALESSSLGGAAGPPRVPEEPWSLERFPGIPGGPRVPRNPREPTPPPPRELYQSRNSTQGRGHAAAN
eukprot:gene14505-biopygen9641